MNGFWQGIISLFGFRCRLHVIRADETDLFNFFPRRAYVRPAKTNQEARLRDADALRGDWQRVGDDMRKVMKDLDENTGP